MAILWKLQPMHPLWTTWEPCWVRLGSHGPLSTQNRTKWWTQDIANRQHFCLAEPQTIQDFIDGARGTVLPLSWPGPTLSWGSVR